jgi:predicted phage-related endonuclease
MQTHNLIQGSPEWLVYRREHFNASDAPAMLGASPYKTRGALLRELHAGVAPEISDQQAYLFARGHKFEGASRGMAEEILGEDLFPVVGSLGRLSASFDGLTMDERTAWEHKMLNDQLRAAFRQMETIAPAQRERAAGRELPLHHRVQMEQQLHVSGAERVLFTASTWGDGGELVEAVHCWYFPDEELRAEILNGWAQFEKDLAAYVVPSVAPAAPAGRAPNVLPALRIEVTGQVTTSNLAEFKATALSAIRSVKRELSTDQDFADAEASVKWCSEIETRLEAAKQHALSQTASIEDLFRTIDYIAAEARRTRLDIDKLVKARKETIREEIVRAARTALQAHAQALAPECAPAALSLGGLGDFAAAVKSKRTVQSLREACDAELARARIALDEQARGIRANLTLYRELATGRESLFYDLGVLLHKAADDFGTAVRHRIGAAEAAEKARAEGERERIRAEEQAKAQREVEVRVREEAAALAKAEGEARARAIAAATPTPTAPAAPAAQPAAAPAAPPPAAANEPATLKLGTISDRLGFSVTAAFVADTLGIAPAQKDGAARLYRESDFPRICVALVAHVNACAARDWRVAA